MNDLENLITSFSTVSDNPISLPLYGDDKLDKESQILMSGIRFIKDSQKCDEQLFW